MKHSYCIRSINGGIDTHVQPSSEGAWATWERLALMRGISQDDLPAFSLRTSPILYRGTTKRATAKADRSKVSGTVGKGLWERYI